MHISEIYKSIYRYYGLTTPLLVDCGKLCGGACCENLDEEEQQEIIEEFIQSENSINNENVSYLNRE